MDTIRHEITYPMSCFVSNDIILVISSLIMSYIEPKPYFLFFFYIR